MWKNSQFTADLFTFNRYALNKKPHLLGSATNILIDFYLSFLLAKYAIESQSIE